MGKITKHFRLWSSFQPPLNQKLINKPASIEPIALGKTIPKITSSLIVSFVTILASFQPLGVKPAQAASGPYCHFTPDKVEAKEKLLKASLEGSSTAIKEYQGIVQKHAQMLQLCRSHTLKCYSYAVVKLGQQNRQFGCVFIPVT